MKPAGYTQIKTSAGRPIYVSTNMYPLYERIFKEYRTDYHMTSIMRTLMSLNADALRGKSLNSAGDERSIIFGHVGMTYYLFNGAVLIRELAIKKPETPDKFGLYSIKYKESRKEWLYNGKIRTLGNTEKWKSQNKEAHYAAVAGRFDRLADAARHMPEHIIGAYKKADYLTSHDKGNQYSLFWIEKGVHKSQGAAEALASIMQQSTKSGLSVNWLIHGDGINTFKNAAKLIQAAPLASAALRAKDATAGKASGQHIYFSNPSNSDSEKSLKALCETAGLTFVNIHTNNRDLRRWSSIKNVGRELGKPVFVSLAAGGASASVSDIGLKILGSGGIDKVVTSGLQAFSSGNYLGAALGGFAAGWLVITSVKKHKAVAATISCTFGNGNQRWYESDKALLR